jgi:hypothetical protein
MKRKRAPTRPLNPPHPPEVPEKSRGKIKNRGHPRTFPDILGHLAERPPGVEVIF